MEKKIRYKKSKCFGTEEFNQGNTICNGCRFIINCKKVKKKKGG